MRALITGGYGFVGRHLARHLVACGDDIAVTYLPPKEGPGLPGAAGEGDLPKSAQSLALDITKAAAVEEVISLLKPDAIYHLAGISFVPEGEMDAALVWEVNWRGTLNILDAVHKFSPATALLVVSSAEVYGEPRPGSLPLTELSELRPISNYGVSKAAADLTAYKYAHREKLNLVRVRPFPHIGPGQAASFAVSSFAKQVAQIKLGLIPPAIKVGNLDARRDYSDVSDIVRGYREALLNGKRGDVYNLCSGKSVAVGEILSLLLSTAEVEAEVVRDPERVRPLDIADLYGSGEKARKDFGWAPRIEQEVTLGSIVDYWLEQISLSSESKR